MAGPSSNSPHRVVQDSTHSSLVIGDHAAASMQAVLDVVAAVRSGGRLG